LLRQGGSGRGQQWPLVTCVAGLGAVVQGGCINSCFSGLINILDKTVVPIQEVGQLVKLGKEKTGLISWEGRSDITIQKT